MLLALFSSSLRSRLNVVSLLIAAAASLSEAQESGPADDAAAFRALAATTLTAPSLVTSKFSDLTDGFPEFPKDLLVNRLRTMYAQGPPKEWSPGLVNIVPAVAYHLRNNLPAKISQPGVHSYGRDPVLAIFGPGRNLEIDKYFL